MNKNKNYLMISIAEKTRTEDENKLYDYYDNFMIANNLDNKDIESMSYLTINNLVSKISVKRLKA